MEEYGRPKWQNNKDGRRYMAGIEQDIRDNKLYFLEILFFFLPTPPSDWCSRDKKNLSDITLQVLLQVLLLFVRRKVYSVEAGLGNMGQRGRLI